MSLLICLLAGVLFGLGMTISQMTDPKIVIAFLDIVGSWRIDLMFVMGGALLVFVPGFALLIKGRNKAVLGAKLALPSKTDIDGRLIIGASLFGLGWGIAGICPGPAFASISMANAELIYFIVPMLIGLKLPQWLVR